MSKKHPFPRRTLANRLLELRAARALAQSSVALAAGLSLNGYTQLERGARSDPPLSTLLKLARAYGLSVGELLADLDPPE